MECLSISLSLGKASGKWKEQEKEYFPFFFRLKRLVLRATSLNDDLISKLTLPYRIYKERVSMIEELDISGKRIL